MASKLALHQCNSTLIIVGIGLVALQATTMNEGKESCK